MGNWDIIANNHREHDFIEIPEGYHRAQITNVKLKKYKTKNRFIITLRVAHCHGKIWYDLWDDIENKFKDKRKWNDFFTSFEIEDENTSNYKQWVGKKGAIRVRTFMEEISPRELWGESSDTDVDFSYSQKVVSCVFGKDKDSLPLWDETFIPTRFEQIDEKNRTSF